MIEFTNPQEGYAFLNRWTTNMESYETRFHGKNVTKVSVTIMDGRPTSATVHYDNEDMKGLENIELRSRLRDEPIPEAQFNFRRRLAQRRKD